MSSLDDESNCDRFWKIIEAIYFNRAERKTIVCGYEDICKRAFAAFQEIETRRPWHLDIQEDHIGTVRTRGR